MRGVTERNAANAAAERISTHTPHARRDTKSPKKYPFLYEFLLTRLMRGVTVGFSFFVPRFLNFYSHASCEA